MTTSIHFTISNINNLPTKTAQYDVRDTRTPGLVVRVNPKGSRTFMFLRRINGKAKRIKIGRFGDITIEAARKAAMQFNSRLIVGIDVLPQHTKRNELTFKELFDRYYAQHALIHTKRPEANKATIEFHIMPKIGSLRLGEVTREILKEHHISQGLSRGKQQANRVLTIVSAVYNYGIREGIYNGANPCIGITRFKAKSRDRFLKSEELQLFFKAVAEEPQIYQDFFMLCIFIGARKSTMLAMKYSQIDVGLKQFRLSEEESKNGEINVYVLSDAALEILKRRHEENSRSEWPSEYVFPSDGITGHLKDPKRSFGRIKERMGVEDIWIHDLRRTLGSYMAINNVSLQIIGQALNHKSPVSTQIYARLSQEPVLEAVNHAADKMVGLLI